jgi:Ca2+-binding EF-hand superfamily protein
MTTAVANDRLKQRFQRWDTNGDGKLRRSDFEQEASRISSAFGVPSNSAEGKELRRALVEMFEFHMRQVGGKPDGELTERQFIEVNEQLMEDEQKFRRMLRPTMRALIGLCDDNHDGQINQAEFTNWLRGIGVSGSKARIAFQQIDANADGQLSEEELLDAVREFHYGRLDVPLLG